MSMAKVSRWIRRGNVEKALKLVNHYCKEATLPCDGFVYSDIQTFEDQENEKCEASMAVTAEWELPCEFMEMYNKAAREGNVLRHGMFPEIRRAWALLDHSLILWRFDKKDGQIWEHRSEEQPILAIGLVKPRPDFVEAQYILVVTTPLELLLFGVSLSQDDDPLTQISVEKLVDYTTSLDGETITCIACTNEGRIFLSGNNGYLYEMLYTIGSPCRLVQCKPPWRRPSFLLPQLWSTSFTIGSANDPVVEMVADNERKSLYIRTQNAKIGAYFLGMDGEGPIEKLGELNNPGKIGELCPPPIFCIAPVSKMESKWSHAQLVIVYKDGSRLYLSTSFWANGGTPDFLSAITWRWTPKKANLILGPTLTENKSIAYCSCEGTLFISRHCQSPHHYSSPVLIISKDSSLDISSGLPTLRELTYSTQIKGCLLFAADVLPTPDTTSTMLSLYSRESFDNTCALLRGRGDLLTQHILPKKKILVFSTNGVIQLDFNRPVDILITLLKERTSLNAFKSHFGADETAAMCLMLASKITFGVDEFDSLVTTRAAGLFEDMKMEEMIQIGFSFWSINSVAHKGLYLLTSRLLYPIWNTRLMSKRSCSDNSMSEYGVLFCRLSIDGMHELESKIRSLANYFIRASDAEDSDGGTEPANKTQSVSNADADSIECCRHLILRSAEALCLLQILSRFEIPVFPRSCKESLRRALIELEFRQLVHSEVDEQIATVLISAMMEIGPWESIKELLLEGCPSYCENAFYFLGDFTTVTNTPLSVPSEVMRKRIKSRQAKEQREAWMSEVCGTSETMMGEKKIM